MGGIGKALNPYVMSQREDARQTFSAKGPDSKIVYRYTFIIYNCLHQQHRTHTVLRKLWQRDFFFFCITWPLNHLRPGLWPNQNGSLYLQLRIRNKLLTSCPQSPAAWASWEWLFDNDVRKYTHAKPSNLLWFTDGSFNALTPSSPLPSNLMQQLLTTCFLNSYPATSNHSASGAQVWKLVHKEWQKNYKKFRLGNQNAIGTSEVNPFWVIPTTRQDVWLNVDRFTPRGFTTQSPLANEAVQSATVHFLWGEWILSGSMEQQQRGKQSHLRVAVNECKSQPIILLLTAREVTAILLPQRRFNLMNVNGEHK